MAYFDLVELAAPFGGDGRHPPAVFKCCDRCLEVARIRQTVCAEAAAPRQFEFLPVIFTDKTPCRTFEKLNPVDQSTGDDSDFLRLKIDDLEFGMNADTPLLRHDQQLAIGA